MPSDLRGGGAARTTNGTGLVTAWLRLELRRRWRSLVVLALLVAVSAGVVLTAVAGARRGASALDRLLDVTAPATLAVLPNQPGFDWDAVRALPGVEAVAEFAVTSFRVDDIAPEAFPDGFPMDRAAMAAVEVPVVLAGRLPDPDRADEVAITPEFTRSYGVGVGDTVDLRLYAPEQFDAPAPPATADGPLVRATVVGTIRSFWFVDAPGAAGTVQPSAGLLERYPAELGLPGFTNVNALVRLSGQDPASVAAFRDGVARVSGRTDIEMFDQVEEAAKARSTLAFEATSLLAFAGAALLAATVLVGQAVARYTAAAVADLEVLRSLGLARGGALRTAVAAPVLAAAAGVLGGAAAAAAASPLFPLGTAALLEPGPGFSLDAPVLGAGSVVLLALCVAGAVGAAAAALRSGAARHPARPSALTALATRAGLPVPVLVGLRFALEPGRGRSALPVRPALVGAVAGVLGVLGALTFSAGVADAAANPERFGQTHRLEAFVGFNGEDHLPAGTALTGAIAADPDVLAVADAPVGVLDTARGALSTFAYGSTGRAPFPTVVLSGRMPRGPDEIALAPRSAAEQAAEVGDTLTVTGTAGAATLRVTGIAFVPYAGHNNYDDGAWVTPDGYAALIDGFKFHPVFVALVPGADPEAVAARLRTDVGSALGIGELPLQVTPALVEAQVIRNVQVLPVVLGGFLALLAVGAVGHALATAVRRRRHDVAVLRAFGMTRGQVRTVVLTQATVLAAVGLLLGVPLGVAVGRTVWRVVADITPLQYQDPLALLALLLAVPVAVLVANALAAWPGRQAARLRIAHVLRAE